MRMGTKPKHFGRKIMKSVIVLPKHEQENIKLAEEVYKRVICRGESSGFLSFKDGIELIKEKKPLESK